jgi:FkbM family methyltransferase
MSFISYAQNFEDVMLWRALDDVTKGFYIDVGAHHPDHDSVTKSFYDKGWHGINIEPVTQWFDLLESKRKRDVNILTAVGSSEGDLNFYEIPGTGLSTLDESVARLHALDSEYEVITRNIPVRTLTDICKEYNIEDIHFLKIDVEGAEKLVIQGVDFNSINPWVILIESTYPNTQNESYSSWEFMLIDAGYIFVYFDGLNRFYVSSEHKELSQRFTSPPNVFDDFSFALDSTSSSFCNEYIERDRKTQKKQKLELLEKEKINKEAVDYSLSLAGIIENKDSELKGALAYSQSQELAAEKSLVNFQEQLLAKENEISEYALSLSSLSAELENKDCDLKEALAFSSNQDVKAKAWLADHQEQLLAKENEISEYALSLSSLSAALENKDCDLKEALAFSSNQDVKAKASMADFQETLKGKDIEIFEQHAEIAILTEQLKVGELALIASKNAYDAQALRLSNIVKSFTTKVSKKDVIIDGLSMRTKYLYGIFFVLLIINLMIFFV